MRNILRMGLAAGALAVGATAAFAQYAPRNEPDAYRNGGEGYYQAAPYAQNGPYAYGRCQASGPHDTDPCDPETFKRADGRLGGESD